MTLYDSLVILLWSFFQKPEPAALVCKSGKWRDEAGAETEAH
jgi:hypothetical protein